jgi:hypothetical protein
MPTDVSLVRPAKLATLDSDPFDANVAAVLGIPLAMCLFSISMAFAFPSFAAVLQSLG